MHEYFIHHVYEEGGGVGEAEGHDCIFIETVVSGECGLGNILLFNFELIISSPQIDLGEHLGSTELIKQIINSWQRVFVFDCDIIQLPVVHTHTKAAIFLVHKNSR